MHSKSCSRCGLLKPLKAFDHFRSSPDKHHHRCKACDRHRDKQRLQDGSLSFAIERWRKRNPQAVEAHKLVQRALRRGELIRLPCAVCSNPKSHAHHDDYGKPLQVSWLCLAHHFEHHRFLRLYGNGQAVFGFIREDWL